MMKQFTGEDIHASFVFASEEKDKPPLVDILADWNKLSGLSRERYRRMAIYLNLFCQQCGRHDLPLNVQSRLCVRCAIDNEAALKANRPVED